MPRRGLSDTDPRRRRAFRSTAQSSPPGSPRPTSPCACRTWVRSRSWTGSWAASPSRSTGRPCPLEALRGVSAELLADVRLELQPGLHFLQAEWPIDELMTLFVTENAPDQFALSPAQAWLEVRGARGAFAFPRLTQVEFRFRQSVQAGRRLGEAGESALACDAAFDPGHALTALFAARLVTGVQTGQDGGAGR